MKERRGGKYYVEVLHTHTQKQDNTPSPPPPPASSLNSMKMTVHHADWLAPVMSPRKIPQSQEQVAFNKQFGKIKDIFKRIHQSINKFVLRSQAFDRVIF